MPTIDRRPGYTKDDDEEVLDTREEVKGPEREVKDDQDGSSPSEQPSEETEEKETIEEDTSGKTVAPASEDKPAEAQDVSVEDRVGALRLEEERLRKQITDLRQERRQVKEEKVIVQKEEPNQLEGIAPQDVEIIEKVIRAKGFVRKDELQAMTYQEKEKEATDAWLAQHPEYLPENDPDDKKWSAIRDTVQAYFKAPPNPRDIGKMLDLAHQMVAPTRSLPVRDKAAAQAAQEKLQSASKATGGSQQRSAPAREDAKKLDPSLVKHLHGFSEEEIKELIT